MKLTNVKVLILSAILAAVVTLATATLSNSPIPVAVSCGYGTACGLVTYNPTYGYPLAWLVLNVNALPASLMVNSVNIAVDLVVWFIIVAVILLVLKSLTVRKKRKRY